MLHLLQHVEHSSKGSCLKNQKVRLVIHFIYNELQFVHCMKYKGKSRQKGFNIMFRLARQKEGRKASAKNAAGCCCCFSYCFIHLLLLLLRRLICCRFLLLMLPFKLAGFLKDAQSTSWQVAKCACVGLMTAVCVCLCVSACVENLSHAASQREACSKASQTKCNAHTYSHTPLALKRDLLCYMQGTVSLYVCAQWCWISALNLLAGCWVAAISRRQKS